MTPILNEPLVDATVWKSAEDHEEPDRKRHLIRMWLTAHGHWADGDVFVQQGIPVKEGVVSDAEDISRASAQSAG